MFTLPSKVVSYESVPEPIPPTPWEYAAEHVSEKWGVTQLTAFYQIINKESGWNPTAQNPTSTAYGLAQFLDSTWATVNCEKTSNPYRQIDCAIKYIDERYGNPHLAWQFHLKNNFY
ncbi:lytic transglycosylase domain-containing protein [Gammaproteobacteria bacterium]|nr:lytic transglycosylase domain-containing protein [Gammaproteobacteria bacterium]